MNYVVIEEAISRHGIVGVFDNVELAKYEARVAAERSDGHHLYYVIPVPLNTNQMPKNNNPLRRYASPVELEAVAAYYRSKDGTILDLIGMKGR